MTSQLRLGAWTIEDHRDREIRIMNLTLPKSATSKSGNVAASTLRAILYRLNFHAGGDVWCFPSYATLAREIDNDPKTVQRAVEALESLGLLTKQLRKSPRGIVCNHYRIEWDRIDFLSAQHYDGHPEQHASCTDGHGQDAPSIAPVHGQDVRSVPHRLDMTGGAIGHGAPHRLDIDVQSPPHRLDTMPPEQGEGEFNSSSSNSRQWDEASRLLTACGVGALGLAIPNAQRGGWTPEQVQQVCLQFLDASIDGVQAWKPELLFRHLEIMAAGTPIQSPPSRDYAAKIAEQKRQLADQKIRQQLGSQVNHAPHRQPRKRLAGTAFAARYKSRRRGEI